MAEFLLEIGTEEIPDWMIEPALADLRTKFEANFAVFGGSSLEMNATPRRLVLRASGLTTQAPDVQNLVPGPYLSAGPKAAEGFARKYGVSLDTLAQAQDAKGERYVFHQSVKGQQAATALAEKLPGIISGIPFPKAMTWPGSNGVRFIRPIRWVLALLDDALVELSLAGLQSGGTTRGHRVLGSPGPLAVSIASYEETLRGNGVILRAEERKQRILQELPAQVRHDEALLATLVYLTEFPSVVRGSFDPAYLELPNEILGTVMRHHQRYFSLVAENGALLPEFLAVTNTDGDPDGLIRQGNERVLRARFNDARFFWQADQRKTLIDRVPDLAKITFQAKLGSYRDKTERVVELAARLAANLGADAGIVARAALLLKCDLTTDMVKEFTELQGVVGGLYAKAQGESEAVSRAIYDHYKPVSMDDAIPATLEGQVVALADKLDTVRECFRIGLIPTGSRDPFALRRAAQGIVRILFEARLPLDFTELVQNVAELPGFFRERVAFYLREVRGFSYDEVNAAMAAGITTLADLADRVAAIRYIRPTEDFEPVAASFKRIQNILKQAQLQHVPPVKADLLTAGPEKDLFESFVASREKTGVKSDYRLKLELMASLRPQVDRFFDKILVNDPDRAIRENRLALLHGLLMEFSNIADFSEIVTQGGL